MHRTLPRIAICILAASPVMDGQLYLISGAPGSYHATDLLEISDAKIRNAKEILPQKVGTKWAGMKWVAISHESGEAVLLSDVPDDRVYVMDLKQAAIVKQCAVPERRDDPLKGGLSGYWLTELPGGELALQLNISGWDGGFHTDGLIMNLDPNVSCERSFLATPPKDSVRHIVAHGTAGIGDLEAADGSFAKMSNDGELTLGTTGVAFGYRIPPEHSRGIPPGTSTRVDINTPRMMLVSLFGETSHTDARFLFLRKSDQTWHELPVRSDSLNIRAFGEYVAAIENTARGADSVFAAARDRRPDGTTPHPESAGRAAWRNHETGTGPKLSEYFDEALTIYPGRLQIYNTNSEKLFTIATNQADSEILLIADNTVLPRHGSSV